MGALITSVRDVMYRYGRFYIKPAKKKKEALKGRRDNRDKMREVTSPLGSMEGILEAQVR